MPGVTCAQYGEITVPPHGLDCSPAVVHAIEVKREARWIGMKRSLVRNLLAAVVILTGALTGASTARADFDAKQLKLVRSASTTLRQAVATAERELKGRAYAASVSFAQDVVVYSVRLLVQDRPLVVTLESKTGKVTGSAPAAGENTALLKDFAKVKGTLLAAIKAAETTAKGKAFEAGFRRVGNKILFEVDAAARDDVEKDVVIDALTDKIRKVTEKTGDAGMGTGTAQQAPVAPAAP
jgi:uncharacterized membrane protein YkoI